MFFTGEGKVKKHLVIASKSSSVAIQSQFLDHHVANAPRDD